jgi:hypothetical protein
MRRNRNSLGKAAAAVVFALLLVATVLGLYRKATSSSSNGRPRTHDEDQLAVSSSGRAVNGEGGAQGQHGAVDRKADRDGLAEKQAAEKQQQELAAQQAAQAQAALVEQQRQLQLRAQAQAAREQQLEADRQRVAAEKQQADAAAAEAERQKLAVAAEAERLRSQTVSRPQPAYSGPSSGTIVWQGEVNGTTLVTIDGNASDTGQVISGALPGVLVMVQPADAKHVGVAGTPAPSNGYRRLMLRIQGKGAMQQVIHWSIP